jgi:RHS repeat-associated protein
VCITALNNVLHPNQFDWSVLERYAYTAYDVPSFFDGSGSSLQTSNFAIRTLFTGREWDNDIQQYHYRARMYDASLGRFCGRDPIGFLSRDIDLYRYVKGNPLYPTDPSGKILPIVAAVVVYEMIVGMGCGIWASEVQKDFPNDKGTHLRHCLFTCCVTSFNLGVPIPALIGSITLDPWPFYDDDSIKDWIADFLGIVAAYDIGHTCLDDCSETLKWCKKGKSNPVKPSEPYVPVSPGEATRDLCHGVCMNRTQKEFPGPSPEATEYYNSCMNSCMDENGFPFWRW